MPDIHRSALVLHTAREMYDLVEDVERYPEFLSWCVASDVTSRTEEEQLASLTVSFAGFERSFTTRNRLEPGRAVFLSLVDGPFERLSGQWQFIPLGTTGSEQGEAGCKVCLDLGFSVQSGLLGAAFARGFAFMADQMVGDFVSRARDVYD